MQLSRPQRLLPSITTLFLSGVYVVNFTLWQHIDSLSQRFSFPQLPPGIIFGLARWCIYTALLVRLYDIWRTEKTENSIPFHLHVLFRVSCAANMLWIVSTVYELYRYSFAALLILFRSLRVLLKEYYRFFTGFLQRRIFTIPIGLYLGRVAAATRLLSTSQAMHLIHGSQGSSHPLRLGFVFLLTGYVLSQARLTFRNASVFVLPFLAIGSLIITHRFTQPLIVVCSLLSLCCSIVAVLRTSFPRTSKKWSLSLFIILLLILMATLLTAKNRFIAHLYQINPAPVVHSSL